MDAELARAEGKGTRSVIRKPPTLTHAALRRCLVGIREREWTDGFSFGAIPTAKQAERWK